TGHAPSLKAAAEPVLVAQHAVDLLRFKARYLLGRGPGTIEAQRRSFAGLHLIRAKTAVGVLRFEYGENTGDAIARQAEFLRLRFVIFGIIGVVVRRNADRYNFAHRPPPNTIFHPA